MKSWKHPSNWNPEIVAETIERAKRADKTDAQFRAEKPRAELIGRRLSNSAMQYRIYMPTIDIWSSMFDDYTRICKAIIKDYGGATVMNGAGSWIDDDGNEIVDHVSIMIVTDTKGLGVEPLRKYANDVKNYLAQNTVLIEASPAEWEMV